MRDTRTGRAPVIWLDVGGVLFANVIEHTPFLPDLAIAWELPQRLVRESYASRQDSLEVGRGALREVWRDLRGERSDVRDHALAASLYLRNLRPIDDGWAFARDAASVGDVYFANNEVGEWDLLREHCYPSDSIVRARMPSYALGIAKPTDAYYRRCLERLDVLPDAVTYFDDDAECVAAARDLGIAAYLWTGAADARRQLARLRRPPA